ncbi:MAG: DUF5683 domain-containing protein [Ginsengibacter sp.]
MLKKIHFLFPIFILLEFFCLRINAQKRNDSLIISPGKNIDTTTKSILSVKDVTIKKHSPQKATFRSAVLPGWGQAYNKKYWKIPIVYGALGTTAAVFFYNLKTYKALKQAYIYISDTIHSNDQLIESQFRNLSPESIRTYRNSFRQNVDYSVLFFLVFWGLNVVDATVDGHLKAFDVSNDITLKIKPGLNINSAGISLVFSFKDNHAKNLSSIQ